MTNTTPDKSDRIETLLEQVAVSVKQIGTDVQRLGTDVQRLGTDVQQLKEDSAKQAAKLETEVKRWDERFFQLTKDNLGVSRTIIITAGATIILAPLVSAISPAIGDLSRALLRIWFPNL